MGPCCHPRDSLHVADRRRGGVTGQPVKVTAGHVQFMDQTREKILLFYILHGNIMVMCHMLFCFFPFLFDPFKETAHKSFRPGTVFIWCVCEVSFAMLVRVGTSGATFTTQECDVINIEHPHQNGDFFDNHLDDHRGLHLHESVCVCVCVRACVCVCVWILTVRGGHRCVVSHLLTEHDTCNPKATIEMPNTQQSL